MSRRILVRYMSSSPKWKQNSPLFADKESKAVLDKMIRVDHAGELGARQIYAGQLAIFRGTSLQPVIEVCDLEIFSNFQERLLTRQKTSLSQS
mmetsp:Transcript_21930/g.89177  ORF Transcript_21930/g.89177 Transcript_21930/m.89177 type:complete len:93 (+) Transcript_21930:497-775(+)